ncbi:MAG TPA: diguanylate cyclase [Burkholderiaceae bacterium]|jgi:diguanylate cyclase
MEAATRPAPLDGSSDSAQTAKAALRRLALDKLEPTPENYARAYRQEAGEPPLAAEGPMIAGLIERVVRGLERGSKGWTPARKKESLQRVLDGSRSDSKRLQQRLTQLMTSWDSEPGEVPASDFGVPLDLGAAPAVASAGAGAASQPAPGLAADAPPALPWGRAVDALGGAVQQALPPVDAGAQELSAALASVSERLAGDAATPELITELEALCERAAPMLQHRHRLVDQLGALCGELTASLTDLAENDSWAKGQCEAMQLKIDEGLSARGVRAVSELLRDTRERQGQLREERERARDSLKGLIHQMLNELDQLGSQTGHFHESVGRYADVIEKADSLESLAGAVREMVEESRTVQALVQQTQARLQNEHSKAQGLSQRVVELEGEMRRLSDEVSTDQLTQIANRRGLMQAFEIECARLDRSADGSKAALSIGLLDIDNFKKLNDSLGHRAGDEALKALAAVVSKTLRPTDQVARYGGEEFVVLLPDTPVNEAQQILTRLQRSLSGGLFMHENKQVFVTFSAGVSAYVPGERIEETLERSDRALYEAKRTGKNRTCIA